MAQLDQLIASTSSVWKKTLTDNFFAGSPVLEYMRAHGKINHDGGKDIYEPIVQAESTREFYKGLSQSAASDNNEVGAAIYDWVFSRAFAVISGPDDWKNKSDAGKLKLWDAKVKIAGATLSDLWSGAFFADGTTLLGADTQLVPTPFETIADDSATYTVGGMTSADVPLWRGNVNASPTANTLTLVGMEGVYVDCSEGSEEPDLVVMSKANWATFWSLVQANQRFLDKDAKVGFKNFLFNNATACFDSHILTTGGIYTDSRAFFINTNHCRLTVGEGMEFVTERKDPTDAHGYTEAIYFAGNFTCDARRYQGVLHDLS